ncbi:MAG TPA: acyl carrier protein, partial [Verrucomicrobiae bacterium]|nr:acyl carrier protein [Verrucomicrobiae bacterium]
MKIEAQIQEYVSRNLLFSDDAFHYDNDASFLREGIIDSMGVMDLVAFVRTDFGIQVDPKDVTPENFDSVNKLAGFIRRKWNPQSAQPL